MGRLKDKIYDVKEQLAIEYFKGDFDDIDELFDKIATEMKIDRSTVEQLYNEMTQDADSLND
jgi:hypothetical protein